MQATREQVQERSRAVVALAERGTTARLDLLRELADLATLAAAWLRTVEASLTRLGRPSPAAEGVERMTRDAVQVGAFFEFLAGGAAILQAGEQLRPSLPPGALPEVDVAPLVSGLRSVLPLLDDLDPVDLERAARGYYDRVFARVHADPSLGAASIPPSAEEPEGLRLDEVESALDE